MSDELPEFNSPPIDGQILPPPKGRLQSIRDVLMRLVSKELVHCGLIGFRANQAGVYVAHIERRLGDGSLTGTTSRVLRIDFEAQVFETFDTVYRWE